MRFHLCEPALAVISITCEMFCDAISDEEPGAGSGVVPKWNGSNGKPWALRARSHETLWHNDVLLAATSPPEGLSPRKPGKAGARPAGPGGPSCCANLNAASSLTLSSLIDWMVLSGCCQASCHPMTTKRRHAPPVEPVAPSVAVAESALE
eukprot:CAMPEP_0178392024 /NCGR_PEP_ID=MMETSP0689_2-20121128/11467_1 /TAXON_ID=160604 /ORGANISM="Amphidinium massartii, Strain CS-259" /LENGTH=150 /DNA_ID=CAMNT_0020012589 /DNA_START=331 /DNA_END=787 /DNA_ORIENTATION=+